MKINEDIPPLTLKDIQNITLDIEQVNKNIVEISKQYKSIQNTLDLIYDDRDLLADISKQFYDLKKMINGINTHNEELAVGIKREVKEKVEDINTAVEEIQDIQDSFVNRIIKGVTKNFVKQDKVLEKKTILQRLTGFFYSGIN